eukprot:TRINITY_DN20293_c0_g1_i1.p1 TRINITY_DN20293_c0_g1~~TRINITY_DN20293_c0_g1_i1.p1  ORF type:complete len:148 (-),score=8.65 TRINITY_DN20293_c0_g1_i1:13-456(-)
MRPRPGSWRTRRPNQSKPGPAVLLKLDLARAFDSVNHHTLHRLCEAVGVHETKIKAIKALYTNVNAHPKTGGRQQAAFARITTGVKQGCVLSPLLFVAGAHRQSPPMRMVLTISMKAMQQIMDRITVDFAACATKLQFPSQEMAHRI